MNTTSAPRRLGSARAVAALLSALLSALLLGLSVLVWPAGAAAAPPAIKEGFLGTIGEARQVGSTWRYDVTVDVKAVFGDARLRSNEVEVRLSATYTRNCGQPTPPGTPRDPANFAPRPTRWAPGQEVLVSAVRDTSGGQVTYIVDACTDINALTEQRLARFLEVYGAAREPRMEVSDEPAVEPDVAVFCADTSEQISPSSLDSGTAPCLVLEGEPDLSRSAAPGLAIVLVGLLGWVLVRQIARR